MSRSKFVVTTALTAPAAASAAMPSWLGFITSMSSACSARK